jgi:hypothetical protein
MLAAVASLVLGMSVAVYTGGTGGQRDGRPYSEEDANRFAATRFKIVSKALGLSPRARNRLWRSLPPAWRRA